MFASFLNHTGMPDDLSALVLQFKDRPWLVLIGTCSVYVLLAP